MNVLTKFCTEVDKSNINHVKGGTQGTIGNGSVRFESVQTELG